MKREEIVRGLRWLRPESGDFACDGCGRERNCDLLGCQIVREAADMLENDESQTVALQRELALRQAQLDCAAASSAVLKKQNEQMRDAAAQVTKLAAEAAEEREWISVEDRLPEASNVVLVTAFWRGRWNVFMGWYLPRCNEWCIRTGVGAQDRARVSHWMPMPAPAKEGK